MPFDDPDKFAVMDSEADETLGIMDDRAVMAETEFSAARGGADISMDRTDQFELSTGQFRDAQTGRFEPGGPPPDYGTDANRFRGATGRFKDRPADHYDEPAEVAFDSLEPKG